MSDAWWVVLIAGATSMLLKAAGPVLVGGRALPPRLVSLVECLAPALFAALIVTQVVGGNANCTWTNAPWAWRPG